MRKLIYVLFFVFFIKAAFGQVDKPIAASTQVLHSIGNTHVSNSGSFNFQQPIVDLELTNGLVYPIKLSYRTRAFPVQEIASNVGLGWHFTGVSGVFRTIKGFPDKLTGISDRKNVKISDFKINKFDGEPDEYTVIIGENIFNVVFNDSNNPIIMNNAPYTIIESPRDGNNRWHISDFYGNEYFFGEVASAIESISFTEKLIIDSVRIERHFDSNGNYPSVDVDSVRKQRDNSLYSDAVVSWFMTSILPLNATQKTTFEYESGAVVDLDDYNIVYSIGNTSSTKYHSGFWFIVRPSITSTVTTYKNRIFSISNRKVNTPRYLKRINFPNGIVEFDYSLREDLLNGRKIDKIRIQDINSLPIKNFVFAYKYTNSYNPYANPKIMSFDQILPVNKKESEHKRLMLSGVYVSDKNNQSNLVIKNHYNLVNILPSRYSQATDDYNYYNNNTYSHDMNEDAMIASIINNGSKLPSYYTTGKSPLIQYTISNTLSKIELPTAGEIIFEYEPNKINLLDSNMNGSEKVSGGIRVKSIKYTSGAGYSIPIIINYSYQDNHNVFSTPQYLKQLVYRGEKNIFQTMAFNQSLIYNDLMDQIQYFSPKSYLTYDAFGIGNQTYGQDISGLTSVAYGYLNTLYGIAFGRPLDTHYSAAMVSTTPLNRNIVNTAPSYETIQMRSNEPESPNRIERKYTGMTMFPDRVNMSSFVYNGQSQLLRNLQNLYLGLTDFSSLRGELIQELMYDGDNNLLKSTEFKYKHILLDSIDAVIFEPFNYVGDFNYDAYKIYRYKNYNHFLRLDSVISTDYHYGGSTVDSIRKYKTYGYSHIHPSIVKTEIEDGTNNGFLLTEHKYPFDLSSGSNIYANMVAKNIFGIPIETVVKKNNNIIGGSLKEFKFDNSNIVESKNHKLNVVRPLDDFLPSTIVSGVLNKDSRYEVMIQTVTNDRYGNPVETQMLGGVSSVTLWGYKGLYPVAQIYNATYDEVVNVLGGTAVAISVMSNFDNSDVSGQYIEDQVKKIRDNLPKAEVITHIYDPNVGITSVTDMRGLKQSFEYDGFGRLITVKDFEGNILQTYCYNYAGQSVDCDGNEISGPPPTLIYAKLEKVYTHEVLLDGGIDQRLDELRGNIIVHFYEDAEGTIPLYVSDSDFLVTLFVDLYVSVYPPINKPYTKLCTGISSVLLTDVPLAERFSEINSNTNQMEVRNTTYYQYYLLSSAKYSIIP